MTAVVREALTGFDWFVLTYFLVLNSGYLVLLVLAGVDVAQTIRRHPFAGHDDTFANPLTPGVSVVVPAFNEEVGIVDSVLALLSLRYPLFEVIVVDDGSTDDTFARLQEAFQLVPVERVINEELPTVGALRSI